MIHFSARGNINSFWQLTELAPPAEFRTHESQITPDQLDEFETLICTRAREREMATFISANPALLTILLDFSRAGHHDAWVIPRKAIRARLPAEPSGAVPSFIVGGKSSGGIAWIAVELKGADSELFTGRGEGLQFSAPANVGVCHLLESIDWCRKEQKSLREEVQLHGLTQPKGYLLIGAEEEFCDTRRQEMKGAWNRLMAGTLQIRTYDALLRAGRRLVSNYRKA